ncbi:hypothetical protein C1752_00014 [Acaryochloris thomasi RCC1774]|uniref:Uncharacterized protein n=1 Tax=Acaryochloris thomasi RCC1774 TaxID=1764569 RepID=A0A2W1JQE4_9CYAN|nr:hypothetical protein C1752_00014 [Acaryochloris thomasi RCC1774]
MDREVRDNDFIKSELDNADSNIIPKQITKSGQTS